jgi:prepilin-type N-terminal cleavage/methylation domain-containing protein
MRLAGASYVRGQSGFTLVELVITSALTLVVMSALTSVILTTMKGASVATGRIEASNQVRNFEFRAADDFARSNMPILGGCGTLASPCTTTPLVLAGRQVTNAFPPVPSRYQVTYTWDGAAFLDRQVGNGESVHIATNVTAFAWYVDGTPPNQTVVVSLTVTVLSYNESQVFRFYPRLNP